MPSTIHITANDDSNEALVNCMCHGEIARKNDEPKATHLFLNNSITKKYKRSTVRVP